MKLTYYFAITDCLLMQNFHTKNPTASAAINAEITPRTSNKIFPVSSKNGFDPEPDEVSLPELPPEADVVGTALAERTVITTLAVPVRGGAPPSVADAVSV